MGKHEERPLKEKDLILYKSIIKNILDKNLLICRKNIWDQGHTSSWSWSMLKHLSNHGLLKMSGEKLQAHYNLTDEGAKILL